MQSFKDKSANVINGPATVFMTWKESLTDRIEQVTVRNEEDSTGPEPTKIETTQL